MAEWKTLACIGLDASDLALVRVVLVEAGKRLGQRWTLGTPDRADLLLLGAGSPTAEAAGLTAGGRGVHCVYVRPGAEAGIDALPTGFGLDDLLLVLSTASGPVADFRSIDASTPEFFDTQPVDDASPDDVDSPAVPAEPVASRVGGPDGDGGDTDALERLLRRDSGEYTLDRIVPVNLSEDTAIDPVQQALPSSRADFRGSVRDPYGTRVPTPGPERMAYPAGSPDRPEPTNARSLGDFLRGDHLVAPCRIQLEGAEPLVLDPKFRTYMIHGDLAAAEPYALARFVESDFQRLTTRDLERWRQTCEPLPYRRLEWLVALRQSDGWLPRHLDPGGSYRVTQMLDLDAHFDEQIRIGEVLRDWRRLHEIAAQAGVDMRAVYQCVTAFDAIGWLQTRPRERTR